MPRKSPTPLKKYTIRLYDGDFDRLTNLHPRAGANLAIRELVHRYIVKQEARLAAELGKDATDLPDVELD